MKAPGEEEESEDEERLAQNEHEVEVDAAHEQEAVGDRLNRKCFELKRGLRYHFDSASGFYRSINFSLFSSQNSAQVIS